MTASRFSNFLDRLKHVGLRLQTTPFVTYSRADSLIADTNESGGGCKGTYRWVVQV